MGLEYRRDVNIYSAARESWLGMWLRLVGITIAPVSAYHLILILCDMQTGYLRGSP